jgi:peptidoglycan/LPS O-acetylase OafA/YrhL
VLFAHILTRIWPEYANYFELGNFGVVLFFLISGFVIPISLERSALRQFWLRRLFRLYPLYWFSIALHLLTGTAQVTTAYAVAWNASMLHPLMGVWHVSEVYWTLTAELLFYIFVSVLFAFDVHKHVIFTNIILIFVNLLATLTNQGAIVWLCYPITIMFTGTAFYQHAAKQRGYPAVILLVGLLLIQLAVVSPWAQADTRATAGWWSDWFLAQVAALSLFSLGYHYGRSMRWWKPVVRLGQWSYSIYLLHSVILGRIDTGSILIDVILGVSLVVGFAACTYAWIEQPGIKLGRWLEQRVVKHSSEHVHWRHQRARGAGESSNKSPE